MRRSRRCPTSFSARRSSLLFGALLLCGCSAPDPPTGNFEAQTVQGADTGNSDADGSGQDAGTTAVPFTGSWLHLEQLSNCVFFVGEFEQLTNYVYIVEAREEDGEIVETWQPCNIQLSELFGLQPAMNPGIYDGSDYPFEQSTTVLTGTEVGDTWSAGPVIGIWGWHPDDRVNDPLPPDETHPQADDTDGDGNPGISLNFDNGACTVYLLQRTHNTYEGEFVEPDRIEGRHIESYSEQSTLGGTASICTVEYDTVARLARQSFERVRIDGAGGARNYDDDGDGSVTCEELSNHVEIRTNGIFEGEENVIEIYRYNHNCCRLQSRPDFEECPVGADE